MSISASDDSLPGAVPEGGASSALSQHARLFEQHRARLGAIAYRMLGSVSDAEDILQEGFLKVSRVDLDRVEIPEAYLTRVVTRLCLDHLRSARVRRETYVGPWLPEPLVRAQLESDPEPSAGFPAIRDDVSMALLLALERLSPLERAAFILHDVFDLEYSEVASALGREEAACRALASRARKHVREQRPRFEIAPQHSERLLAAFARTISEGDVSAVQSLLTEDARLVPDSGGRVSSAMRVLVGPSRVARFLVGVQRRFAGNLRMRAAIVAGMAGWVIENDTGVHQVCAFDIRDDKIQTVYVVRNPDKLRHVRSQLDGDIGAHRLR